MDPPKRGNRRRPGHKACQACKAYKIRCVRDVEEIDVPCRRCRRHGIECELPQRPPRKIRSGTLLELAKTLYGDTGVASTSTSPAPLSVDSLGTYDMHERDGTEFSEMDGHDIGVMEAPTTIHSSSWSIMQSTPPTDSQRSGSTTRVGNTDATDYEQDDFSYTALSCSWISELTLTGPSLSEYSVENLLATAEVHGQLSSHFIEELFAACQFLGPLSRWKELRNQFELAGRRLDQLESPRSEALAALLISSGARVSSAPCLLGVDVTGMDLSKGDLAYFGRRRAAACDALSQRAIRLVDERGLFRDESHESIAVLIMFATYLDRADPQRIKGRPYRAAAAAHARAIAEDKTDDWCKLVDGALAYLLYINDTWTAASSGRTPNLSGPVEDLIFRGIKRDLPTIDELSCALSGLQGTSMGFPLGQIWAYLTRLMRDVDHYLRQGPRVHEIWTIILEAYERLDEFKRCFMSIQSSLNQFLISRRPGVQLLRQHIAHTILPGMLVTFYIHRALKSWVESSYNDLSSESRTILLALKAESDRRMAQSARELAQLFGFLHETLPSPGALALVPAIEIAYETLPVWAEQLVAVPTVEDAVPTTYTIKEKIQELRWFMGALHGLGWSYADEFLDKAKITVQRGLIIAEAAAALGTLHGLDIERNACASSAALQSPRR